jgi:hypothetical protein
MPLEEHLLLRDDGLDLRFQGYLVGVNDHPPHMQAGTLVRIFVTRAGKIVTAVHQWRRADQRAWSRKGNAGIPPIVRQKNTAAVHDDPRAAVQWLIEDGKGRLGRSSAEAWKMACQTWPTLRGLDVEEIG